MAPVYYQVPPCEFARTELSNHVPGTMCDLARSSPSKAKIATPPYPFYDRPKFSTCVDGRPPTAQGIQPKGNALAAKGPQPMPRSRSAFGPRKSKVPPADDSTLQVDVDPNALDAELLITKAKLEYLEQQKQATNPSIQQSQAAGSGTSNQSQAAHPEVLLPKSNLGALAPDARPGVVLEPPPGWVAP